MDQTSFKEEDLCALARSGDSDAEEILLLRYSQLVRLCARPLFLFGGDSEDLTQEGMLGLLRAIRSYDPDRGSSFRTYAELCIRRSMFSAIRRAAALRHAALNDSLPMDRVLEECIPEPDSDPESVLLLRETMREQMEAVNSRLSPLEKQVFERYQEGMTYAEIAQALNRPRKTIDNAIQRIRRKLEG